MKDSIIKLLKNDYLKGTFLVTFSMLLGSVFSYLLQIVLARYLTISEFGDFSAVLALTYIFAIPSTAFGTAVVKIVSDLNAKKEGTTLSNLFYKLFLFQALIGLLIALFLFIFRSYIAGYLNIIDSKIIVAFAFNIFAIFLTVVSASYLQGLLRFKAYSFLGIIGSLLRFLLPSLFVILGYKVAGVFFSIGISLILSFILGVLVLKKNLIRPTPENLQSTLKTIFRLSLISFLMTIGMMLLNSIDVLMVKHYFSSIDSGIYSSLVTVGKVLLFGSSTVSLVMFPQVSTAFSKGEDYKKKFLPFLILQLIPLMLGISIFFLFPSWVISLLFGEKFIAAAVYLPLFSIFVCFYVLINFFLLYFLAIGKSRVFIIQAPFIFLQVLLIWIYHSTIFDVIKVNILISTLLFVSLIIYYKVNAYLSDTTLLQKRKDN